MEYIILGKTNLRISRIGFGGWGIGGGAKMLRWKDMWKADDSSSKKSLWKAYEKGINFFDTALIYGDGHSERLIAETLRDKKIVIVTKVPPLDGHWPARDSDIQKVFPKDYIIEKAKISYNNLGKRTIDILLLHVWLDSWFESNEWRNAFNILRDEKIVNHIGVSINDNDPNSALRLVNSGNIDVVEVVYNIFDQSPRDKLFPLAKKKNIGIIARVPLDEGSLSGGFSYSTEFNDWRKDYFTPDRLKETIDRVNRIKKKLMNNKRTMTQIALNFCLVHDGADVAIVGMRNPNHIDENIHSLDISLTPSEINYLTKQRWIRNFYPEDV